MKVVFRTNLDEAKREKWPPLDHVPQIGAAVVSASGVELRVVGVTYERRKAIQSGLLETVAQVELHLRPGLSIADWMAWMKRRHDPLPSLVEPAVAELPAKRPKRTHVIVGYRADGQEQFYRGVYDDETLEEQFESANKARPDLQMIAMTEEVFQASRKVAS